MCAFIYVSCMYTTMHVGQEVEQNSLFQKNIYNKKKLLYFLVKCILHNIKTDSTI